MSVLTGTPLEGTSLDPDTSHSIWNLSNWTGGSGGDEGVSESAQAAAAEAALKIKKDKARADVNEAFSEYGLGDTNSPYFKRIARDYRDYAMNAPVTGIQDQKSNAMADLVAQLSRQGMLDSSTMVDREALAKKLFAKAQVDAASRGREKGETVRGTLRDAKGQALADINAATDPASAANFAINNISAQSDPGKFDPMLDVFYELTRGLALRQETEQRRKQNAQLDQMYSSLSGPGSSTIVKGG